VIRRIKEIISDEVDYLIWNEDDSILYVRGIIKVISPKSTSQIYDRIFVEGLKEEDTECNSAYVYVRDYTKIVKLIDDEGEQALTFDDLQQGIKVEVWVTYPILLSDPPHASATTIKIIE
jgi:hypothetical protein